MYRLLVGRVWRRMTEVRRTSRARLPQLALLVICIFPTGRGDRLMKTVVVRAGENATIPCPGLTEVGRAADYIIGRLTWTCPGRRPCPAAAPTGQLASYAARTVSIEGDRGRLDLDRRTWALLIAPARAADSGAYSCSFNDQPSDHRIVKLEVQGVPSPPGRPMVIKHTSRHIDLSWAPSLQTNNSPIKHYVIQTRYGDTGTWPAVEAGHRTAGSQTNATVADLTPFTVYTFRVVAANDMGYSRPSDASYPVSTLRERPGAPPKLTYARNRSSTSIEVGWRPPADHTLHGEFTGYHLTYRRAEPGRRSGPASSVQLHDVSDRSYFIEDLEPYTRYEITLQVKNPQDLGPPATITATTGEGVPSRPVNVSFSSVRDRSVVLRWVPPRRPNGLVRGYNAYWTADKGQVMRRAVPDGDRRTFTITNLDPDTEYSVWLKAVTGAGEGDRSFPVRARTDVSGPGAPVITNITCPTDTSLGLQWRKPEIVYGLVDLYYLLYRSGDSRDFIERMVPVQSDRLQYTINLPNLTANQVYEIRIQGATVSRLDRNKVYNGQQSLPRKVRMERGCEEIQLYSTWKHRPHTTLAGSEVTGIFVGCLLVLFLVITAVIWRRRQKRYPAETADKMAASVAGSVLSGWGAPAHEAVPSHLFSQHVRQQHADADDGFRREWEMLQMAAPLADDARTSGAAQKNGQTAASDASTGSYYSTRVPITSRLYRHRPTPAAYYVDGYQRARAFIVTDRPSAASHDALWRLVWEQGVTTLVLIGTLEPKGGRLWPERGAQRPFGDLQVEHREELPLAACCVRKLVVSKLKSKSSRSKKERGVNFFQYTYWPEFGLPEDTLPLLDFVQRTLQHESASNAPVLFISATSYCAAGLYVGLVSLLTQLKYRAELGVYSYWQHVIGQCPYLLTTVDEYSFLHDCLLERVTAGETLVPRNDAHHYIEQLQDGCRGSFPYPAAENQYKHAIALEARQYMVVSAAKPCNEAKNRSLSYIPMETSRVRLRPDSGLEGADYINASWLPGYRLMQEYILTQHPLPNTVLDFWQMVWDHRVTTVTCLSPEDFGVFWPLEEEELYGRSFVIRYMSESADCSATYKSSWIIRSFLMESTEGMDDVTVRIVHLPLWPEECSTDSVVEGVLGVTEIQGDRRTPLLVIDRYGGTEGASFCLLSSVLRQLQHEGCFDIFTYAKLYHQRRPGIWKTMREFLYLYHAVEAWLSAREGAGLYRSDSCTSICQNRRSLEVRLSGVSGAVV